MTSAAQAVSLVKRFEEIGLEDVPSVGGKNASLGEMVHASICSRKPLPCRGSFCEDERD